jgi:signal peptidase II
MIVPEPSPATGPDERPPAPPPGKPRYLLLSLGVLVLDQWSKWMVDVHLPEQMVQPLVPGLNLIHVENPGVAFGLFAATGRGADSWLLTALGLVALTLVGFYFLRVPRHNRLLQTALALVLGGAVGNLLDRVAAGAVTDFIDFYVGTWHWHTFNVADSAISIGIALIAWDSLRSHRRAPGTAPAA